MPDFSDAELSALRRAYASGSLRVEYEGKSVTYDDEAGLLRRIRYVEGSIDRAAGTVRRRSVRIYADGKGN